MNQNFRDKIRLFFCRLLGMENEEEKKELDEWLECSPEGRDLLNEMSDGNAFKRRRELIDSLNIDEELHRVLVRSKKRSLKVILRAAVIILPLIIGSLAFYFVREKDQQVKLGENRLMDIRPGIRGALLELSDGRVYNLKEKPQLINERNGREIQKDSTCLNYRGDTLVSKQDVIYNRLLVGRGHEYMLILSDGTKVWINAQSELRYPVTFEKGVRRVFLSGEAYFEVVKDSTSPFIVEVDKRFEIKVLGTCFNVKAYSTDYRYETTLVSGKVEVEQPDGVKVVLKPSEQLVIEKDGKSEVREVDTDYYLAWHEGWFYFEDLALEQALEMLGRWYDVTFMFADHDLKAIRVTGKVKRFENLNVILEMLMKTAKVEFTILEKSIVVNKK